jgi:predicted extracellular nuclease
MDQTGNGAPLPTPDVVGSINMAAGSGKVAIVTGTDPLGCPSGATPCTPAQLARVVDLVGYGTANTFEGTPAPTLTNTTAARRAGGGCVDTDDNGVDFTAAAPEPRTSTSPVAPCGGGGPATPVATCPPVLRTPSGTATSTTVSATDADSAIASITITSPAVGGITLAPTGAGTARLDVAATTVVGTHAVVVEFATDDDPPQVTSCTIAVTVEAPPTLTAIATVQGSGPASLLVGADVVVEGIVTSIFTRQDAPDGFFVQSAVGDGDESTSDGIFVFCRGSCPTVTAGDLVRVTGEVAEFFGMTQVDATTAKAGRIAVVSSGNPLPVATPVTLPAGGSTHDEATFEPVEGMVVQFAGPLVVSEYFELAQFGQLVLSADERPYQYTHDHAPSAPGYAAFLADLATRQIILDDDNNDNNDAISHGPDEPYPYPSDGLSIHDRMRGGDTIEDLTGVLHWSFAGQTGTDAWRIRPIPGVEYTFTAVNTATARPQDVGGDLRIASFNVLNYFATIDTAPTNSGPCGPLGTLDCRGADSAAELVRQRAKIVSALVAIDADVVGLVEIHNDAGQSVDDLLRALNAAVGPARAYAAVETGTIGTDAIKVAFIYRPSTVEPIGDHAILDTSVDPRFLDDKNRPALVQTFAELATGERFTASINHFKSKGSSCADVGDPDRSDGQANCSVTRTQAAEALADFLATDPTDSGDADVIVMGDLNSYREERPIVALEANGYTDLIAASQGPDAYGYLFDGQLGYLDHALATASMTGQVTGATEWHINADEPPLFDYNDELLDPGEASFQRESSALPLYEPNARRSSDHDPVVVGLDLSSLHVDDAVIIQGARGWHARPVGACRRHVGGVPSTGHHHRRRRRVRRPDDEGRADRLVRGADGEGRRHLRAIDRTRHRRADAPELAPARRRLRHVRGDRRRRGPHGGPRRPAHRVDLDDDVRPGRPVAHATGGAGGCGRPAPAAAGSRRGPLPPGGAQLRPDRRWPRRPRARSTGRGPTPGASGRPRRGRTDRTRGPRRRRRSPVLGRAP